MKKNIIEDLLYKEECFQIVGMAMKVHSRLKSGFKEIVYKDGLEVEFKSGNIPYEREKLLLIKYEGSDLRRTFKCDFLLYDKIIIEVKATDKFCYKDFAQTLNYLRCSEIKLGLLLNFGSGSLRFKRIICSH